MESQKLPYTILLRAQNILQEEVSAVYSTDNSSVVKVERKEGGITYVDLTLKKEVSYSEKDMKEWGKEDTLKLAGKEEPKEKDGPVYLNQVLGSHFEEASKEPVKKIVVKKAVKKKTK